MLITYLKVFRTSSAKLSLTGEKFVRMSALEGWARAWLVEPKYVTVFKPTMDVVKDYICTISN